MVFKIKQESSSFDDKHGVNTVNRDVGLMLESSQITGITHVAFLFRKNILLNDLNTSLSKL